MLLLNHKCIYWLGFKKEKFNECRLCARHCVKKTFYMCYITPIRSILSCFINVELRLKEREYWQSHASIKCLGPVINIIF